MRRNAELKALVLECMRAGNFRDHFTEMRRRFENLGRDSPAKRYQRENPRKLMGSLDGIFAAHRVGDLLFLKFELSANFFKILTERGLKFTRNGLITPYLRLY